MMQYRAAPQLSMIFIWLLATPCHGVENQLPLWPASATYHETTGSEEKNFFWKAEKTQDGQVVITLDDGQVRYQNFCDTNGETIEWRYSDEKRTRLQAVREERRIIIRGTMNGEKVESSVAIDDRPWYQALSYSLRGFLVSEKEYTSFWTIRANTLDVHALQAKKLAHESIDTVAGPTMTSQVEVRVEGLLSGFWHATYWYRQEDGLFLRYRSVHGTIGTDPTLVNIVSAGTGRTAAAQ